MIKVSFKASFVREWKRLPAEQQDEVYEKIELLKHTKNHKLLKVHKLHGRMKKYYAFSVDYRTRVLFEYFAKNEVLLLGIGDHDLYK